MKGAFTLVLPSHLPYVGKAGRWPHGEEMVHEAIAQICIPLLNALFDPKNTFCEPRLTVALTPVLSEHCLPLPPFGVCAQHTAIGSAKGNGRDAVVSQVALQHFDRGQPAATMGASSTYSVQQEVLTR